MGIAPSIEAAFLPPPVRLQVFQPRQNTAVKAPATSSALRPSSPIDARKFPCKSSLHCAPPPPAACAPSSFSTKAIESRAAYSRGTEARGLQFQQHQTTQTPSGLIKGRLLIYLLRKKPGKLTAH
jgi:hypothetical protein